MTLSPTAVDLTTSFEIQYGIGSVEGYYVSDDLFISGAQIQDQQFGVVTDSERVWFSIMGLGFGRKNAGSPGHLGYDSLIDNLYDQNYTNSRLFGLELGAQGSPQIAVTGQIVFGGLDTNKFSGKLGKVEVDIADPHYRVNLSSVSHRAPTSLASTIITSSPLSVVMDSGTTLSIFPRDIVELFASHFPGAVYDGDGGYRVPCCHQSLPGSLDFTFGDVSISVPYSEFIWNAGFYNDQEHCQLGVQWDTTPDTNKNNNFIILGDTFMRATYMVFDQDNDALYMSNYVKCGDSSLVAVKNGFDGAANIQGSCQPFQPSTTANVGTCTGVAATRVTSTPTGAKFTGDPNPVGLVSVSSSMTSSRESTITSSCMANFTNDGNSVSTTAPFLPGGYVSASMTSLGTLTSTATTQTPTATVTGLDDTPIILGVIAARGAAQNATTGLSLPLSSRSSAKKRQTDGGFIGGAGPVNPSSCSSASNFRLTNGQLISGGQIVNTEPGIAFMPLRVSPYGSINNTFVVVGNALHWFNDAFSGGEAGFCQMSDEQVVVTFAEIGVPADCVPVSLAIYQEYQCKDGKLELPASSATPSSTITTTVTTASEDDQFSLAPVVTTINTITSTITRFITYTITACSPSVQNCPMGQIATNTEVYVTTICHDGPQDQPTPTPAKSTDVPVKGTSVDGGGAVAVVEYITLTEECEMSTFAVPTALPDDTNCVLGRTTTWASTIYRTTVTAFNAVETDTGAGAFWPVLSKGIGVQMGPRYSISADSDADVCPSCQAQAAATTHMAAMAAVNLVPVQAGASSLEVRILCIVVVGMVGLLHLMF
ncbi:aspartic peptidase domain-containing protein [Truncatella angustata]|uniref:Aspartic peptidase domain-containing protein n=1 Tax=Truncatella angustata TaxID=152316 RepID=A0A9P8UJU7_9PEZI|nr:aspartic peptidase domain-containing protein [Truncatella angustata]KAH6653815.1 aspartic peptidase domain-containing protein [Truncatella angustata]